MPRYEPWLISIPAFPISASRAPSVGRLDASCILGGGAISGKYHRILARALTSRTAFPWILAILLHLAILFFPIGLWWSFQTPGTGISLSLVSNNNSSPAPSRSDSTARAVKPRPQSKQIPEDAVNPAVTQTDDQAKADAVAQDAGATEATSFSEEGSGGEVSGRIGWQNGARELVRRSFLPFPKVLSNSGQEVDCAARITVTPLGTVAKVEIIESSGYTEIDASVRSALWGYVFSRDYGVENGNAVAVVRFRFRLEMLD
jgi:hypothetical protein